MSTERDPPRLATGGEGVPPALANALRDAATRRPNEAVLALVERRLFMAGGGGGGEPGPEGTAAASKGAVAAPASIWTGIVAGAGLGVVVGLASLALPSGDPVSPGPSLEAGAPTSSAGAPAAQLPSAAAPRAAPESLAEQSVSPETDASGSGRVGQRPLAPAPSSSPPADSAQEPTESEADYLRRAHALLSGSPAQALALAEAHPRLHPTGKLAQERELIAITALVSLGRDAAARARGEQFLSRFPGSAHRRRLEVLLPGLAGSAEAGVSGSPPRTP